MKYDDLLNHPNICAKLIEHGMPKEEEEDYINFFDRLDEEVKEQIRIELFEANDPQVQEDEFAEDLGEDKEEVFDNDPQGKEQEKAMHQSKKSKRKQNEDDEDQEDELKDWVQDDYDIPPQLQSQENQRYTDAAQLKRQMDNNVQKMKARVQLLKMTEQRNLQKARLLDINSEKIQLNKQAKYERQQRKYLIRRIENDQQIKKRQEIQASKERHLQIIRQKQGNMGHRHQKLMEDVQQYKESLRTGYKDTLSQVFSENRKLHDQIKYKERIQLAKSQELWDQKYQQARNNYRSRVKDELNWAMLRQNELEELERKEARMLEKIKITQQIYQNASYKNNEIKRLDYQDLLKTS